MRTHFENLDLLKILLTICIVFHHFQQMASVRFDKGINFFGGRFYFGYLVELFFIVSGFLTEFNFQNDERFFPWIVSKLNRLLPFSIFACVFSLATAFVYYRMTGEHLFGLNYDVPTILTSLLLIHAGWVKEYSPAINNPTWYLCILILCYFLFWCIRKCYRGNKTAEILGPFFLALFGFLLNHARMHGLPSYPFLRVYNIRGYSCFFLGCALCQLLKMKTKRVVVWVAVVIWLLVPFFYHRYGISNWYVLSCLYFPAIVLAAVLLPQVKIPGIRKIGAISFEVYLWHVPVYGLLLVISSAIDGKIGNVIIQQPFLTMLLFCAVVWVAATVIYYLIEKPLSQKLSRVIFTHINKN